MLWNLLTAGIFGTDYYIKKKIQHIGKERSEGKVPGRQTDRKKLS